MQRQLGGISLFVLRQEGRNVGNRARRYDVVADVKFEGYLLVALRGVGLDRLFVMPFGMAGQGQPDK